MNIKFEAERPYQHDNTVSSGQRGSGWSAFDRTTVGDHVRVQVLILVTLYIFVFIFIFYLLFVGHYFILVQSTIIIYLSSIFIRSHLPLSCYNLYYTLYSLVVTPQTTMLLHKQIIHCTKTLSSLLCWGSTLLL
jgi:hypothetical protein